MCGVAGHFAAGRVDVAAVRRMMTAMGHRGPDGEGLYSSTDVVLGHRRLSIIDLTGGAQPISNEDGTVIVVLNGEIYNYRELTEELKGRHQFRTASDTEVIVHLYEDYGDELVQKLRGMYAFALWDEKRRRLLVVRDRLGKKPIVYAEQDGALWFASELHALSAAGAPLGGLDRAALAHYLELLYVPAPRTIWTGAKKLPAGHLLIADANGVSIRRYWTPPRAGSRSTRGGREEWTALTAVLVEDAVKLRLRSDVPVGVLLSGGLDSSVVTAFAARNVSEPLRTFSVGFGRGDDELPIAVAVANRYGTMHQEIVIQTDVVEATLRALNAFSEPFGDSSAVPCSEVFREVAKHVKVVLTGDGGDELFAGYGRHRLMESLPFVPGGAMLASALDLLPPQRHVQRLRRALRAFGRRGPERYRALVEVFSRRARRLLLGHDATPSTLAEPSIREVDSALDCDLNTYLPDDLLVKTDITSMMWSVEARCPLLDQELVEAIVPLPAALKQDRRRGKLLLRDACHSLLPDEVLTHPKRGFGSPVEQWLRGPLRSMLSDLVLSERAKLGSLVDAGVVRRLVGPVLNGHGNGHQAWALLALAAWNESV